MSCLISQIRGGPSIGLRRFAPPPVIRLITFHVPALGATDQDSHVPVGVGRVRYRFLRQHA